MGKHEFGKILEKPEGSSDWVITGEGTFITNIGTKLQM